MFSLSQTAYFINIFEVFKDDYKDFIMIYHLNQDFLDISNQILFFTLQVNIKYYNILFIIIYEIKVDNAYTENVIKLSLNININFLFVNDG